MTHRNAKLTALARLTIVHRLRDGWTQAQTATAMGVSRATVAKSAGRPGPPSTGRLAFAARRFRCLT